MLFFNRNKIGKPLKIADCEGKVLHIGDKILYHYYDDSCNYNNYYIGIILYNSAFKEYGVAISNSMWYGTNPYDIKSYGKFVSISMNKNDSMNITKLN